MNINYQKNILNIPIINSNYAYTQPKYVASLYSSPKKNIGNFSFNYGMRHYYSAEIKSSSKTNLYFKSILCSKSINQSKNL